MAELVCRGSRFLDPFGPAFYRDIGQTHPPFVELAGLWRTRKAPGQRKDKPHKRGLIARPRFAE